MKRFYMINVAMLIAIAGHLFAQTSIPNYGFEDWTTVKGAYDDPNEWTTSNKYTTDLAAGTGVNKSTDKFEGQFSARLITLGVGFAGQPYPAYLVNGAPSKDKITGLPKLESAGTPYNKKPVALTGYYTFEQNFPNDSGEVVVILKKMGTKKSDTVSIGYMRFAPASTFTRFRLELIDLMPGAEPDSIAIAFFSTNPLDPISNGRLHIDSLGLDFATAIDPLEIPGMEVQVFPNPTSGTTNFQYEIEDPTDLSLFDLSGKKVFSTQLTSNTNMIDLSFLAEGVYSYQIGSEERRSYGKLIVR